jgi:hypothetical protein
MFIIHHERDTAVADALKEFLVDSLGLDGHDITLSRHNFNILRAAELGSPVLHLSEANIIIAIYSFASLDWSNVAWQLGVAFRNVLEQRSRLVVLRCSNDDIILKNLLDAFQTYTIDDRPLASLLETIAKHSECQDSHTVSKLAPDFPLKLKHALLHALPRAPDVAVRQVGMFVTPIFGPPKNPKYAYDLFVLMPFASEFKLIYEDHIKNVAKNLDMSVARADDFFTTGEVMDEVWQAIAQSTVIIADCTGRNPNVFYEIGLADVAGKPVILITQQREDIPFDLRHRRYIEYAFTPRGMLEFEGRLKQTVGNLKE